MIQVDFYILDIEAARDADNFACRLTEKAYKGGHNIYLYTVDEPSAARLNDRLWTFKQGSFLPHEIANSVPSSPHLPTPIVIGYGELQPLRCDTLINLTTTVPPHHAQFQRIAEVIYADEPLKAAGRERFRFYKQQGYQVNSHTLSLT